GNFAQRDALRQIGSLRLGLLGGHGVSPHPKNSCPALIVRIVNRQCRSVTAGSAGTASGGSRLSSVRRRSRHRAQLSAKALELSQFMSPNSNHAAPEGRRRQRSPESLIWVRRALRPLLCPCCEPFVVARDPEHRFPRLRVLYLLREGASLVCAIAPVFRVIDESLRHDRLPGASPLRLALQAQTGAVQQRPVAQAALVALAMAGLLDDGLREHVTHRLGFTLRPELDAASEEPPPRVVERGDQHAHVVGAEDPVRVPVDGDEHDHPVRRYLIAALYTTQGRNAVFADVAGSLTLPCERQVSSGASRCCAHPRVIPDDLAGASHRYLIPSMAEPVSSGAASPVRTAD